MTFEQTVELNSFNDSLINPTEDNFNTTIGGSKIVVIGKAGTGKSTLIKYLILTKRNLIPVGMVISGTEDSNSFYSSIFPKQFIHTEYSEDIIQRFIKRQKLAISYLSNPPNNPWALLLLDDCTDDRRIFNSKLQQSLFKNGRHWKMLYILSLQYSMDIPPPIRSNIDGVFIFKETNENNLNNIYKNYGGVFPTIDIFKECMKQITGDYTALYIDNCNQDNKQWYENVYYWKVPKLYDEERFGCHEYNNHHYDDTQQLIYH